MPTPPKTPLKKAHRRVLVAIGTGYGYGRDMIAGVVSYARVHGPWEFVGQTGPVIRPAAITRSPQYDGVIFQAMEDGFAEAARRRGAPAVSVGGRFPAAPDIPHVTADGEAVARMAFDYLRGLGFNQFATYGGHTALRDTRIGGFMALAKAAGCQCTDLGPGSPHQPVSTHEDTLWTREIRRLKGKLSTLTGRVALFAWSSREARPVIAACDELGLPVPDRIAVMGVDDDEAVCELASPPITAIDHGCETMGWQAAQTLDALMQGRPAETHVARVDPVRVVERQSTQTLAIDQPVVVAAINFIKASFAEGITVQDVLDEVDCSRPTLEKHFRHAMGQTVREYITKLKIGHAQELLQLTTLDHRAISVRCGFSYPSKFSTAFRRETGLSPSDYRRLRRARGGTLQIPM
ncbi:MAG: substrate-binding domain-containing protein [Planctomycetota bacterium]